MDQADDQGAADGVTAVLYGMFTSFTEVLDGLDQRLAAIEEALSRAAEFRGDADGDGLDAKLAPLVEALRRQGEALDALASSVTTAADARAAALGETVEARAAALDAAIEEVRTLLRAHVDDTSHSLARRAGEAGRRLASDLGIRPRPRPGSGQPGD